MENKEYFLLNEEYVRPLDGKWTDKLTVIPAGTIIHKVRKRDEETEGFGFIYIIKETGVETILYNYTNVIENTPENLELLKQYKQKKLEMEALNNELGKINSQFVKLGRWG
jgi:hypothetical protein